LALSAFQTHTAWRGAGQAGSADAGASNFSPIWPYAPMWGEIYFRMHMIRGHRPPGRAKKRRWWPPWQCLNRIRIRTRPAWYLPASSAGKGA